MLPHEAEVMAEIATKYHVQFEAMTALHDAVVSMMTAGSWTVRKRRGLAPFCGRNDGGPADEGL